MTISESTLRAIRAIRLVHMVYMGESRSGSQRYYKLFLIVTDDTLLDVTGMLGVSLECMHRTPDGQRWYIATGQNQNGDPLQLQMRIRQLTGNSPEVHIPK